MDRKGEEEINGRLIKLKGYDILDTVTGRHTTRTREDIRVKKKSKLEDQIYKEYVEFLNKMHRASNNRTEGEEYKKPLFKESHRKNDTEVQKQTTQETQEEETTETQQAQPEAVTTPPEEPTLQADEPIATQPEQPVERKLSREEKNLKSDLGNYWRCTDHDPHYDGGLGRRLRARVTELNENNEETIEDYWILENEDDEYFTSWKKVYQANQRKL